jgi:hypothetical protein
MNGPPWHRHAGFQLVDSDDKRLPQDPPAAPSESPEGGCHWLRQDGVRGLLGRPVQVTWPPTSLEVGRYLRSEARCMACRSGGRSAGLGVISSAMSQGPPGDSQGHSQRGDPAAARWRGAEGNGGLNSCQTARAGWRRELIRADSRLGPLRKRNAKTGHADDEDTQIAGPKNHSYHTNDQGRSPGRHQACVHLQRPGQWPGHGPNPNCARSGSCGHSFPGTRVGLPPRWRCAPISFARWRTSLTRQERTCASRRRRATPSK